MIVRPALPSDATAIAEIYNHAIDHTTATFDTEHKSVKDREEWISRHNEKYPVLVLETDGMVIGWASMSQWSDRCAYNDTAEISIYLRPEYQGKGYGKKLFAAIVEAGKKGGLHCVLSRITAENSISVTLHEQFGFRMVGTMKEVGRKFGRLIDVHMMQLIYE